MCESADRPVPARKVSEVIDLMVKTADWQALATLLSRVTPPLLAQGDHAEVLGWLHKVPTDILKQEPGLCYWMGAGLISVDFVDSRNWFERAFVLYSARHDNIGKLLSWASIVETIFLEWADFSQLQQWIVVGEQLLDECGELPVGEVEQRMVGAMFNALVQAQPDHPDIEAWAARLFELIRLVEDDNQRLLIGTPLFIYYTRWLGEHARAEIVYDMLRPPPERCSKLSPMARIMLAMMECSFHWNRYAIGAAEQVIREGIETAKQANIHAWDFLLNAQPVYAGLSSGDYVLADRYLCRLKELIPRHGPLEQAHYHYLVAWRAMLFDDTNRAMEHLRYCLSMVNEQNGPMQYAQTCIALARVHHALGEDHEIPPLLAHIRKLAQGASSPLLTFMACYLEAAFALDNQDDAVCLAALTEAMKLASRHGYLNFAWCLPSVLARLCIKAIEANIETHFVRCLIRTRQIVPDVPPMHMECWPWSLKIYTLGRFSLIKDDISVSFSRKAQSKPLKMLKVLIALGGREVPEAKLSDALWPHVDGDNAHSSFTTTLSRLRKLVGNNLLYFRDGHLTLDARRCWVDVWALQRVLGKAQDTTDAAQAEALTRKAIDLYHGPFLNGEDGALWLDAPRSRMRKQLVHTVMPCIHRLIESGNKDGAISLCQKVIMVDPDSQPLFERFSELT